MKVLVTGPFGHLGLEVLNELLQAKHQVRAFDLKTAFNLEQSIPYQPFLEVQWGDLRKPRDLEKAVQGQEAILHLGAVIPPLSVHQPALAQAVNVEGTMHLIQAAETIKPSPKLIFASSVTVYGDRRQAPLIKLTDSPAPHIEDDYARQKLAAEQCLVSSTLNWSIYRLAYIVSTARLEMDPLMFDMALDTPLEVCHSRDAAKALVDGILNGHIDRKILLIGGGRLCQTTYQDYLDHMTEAFGLGKNLLPPEAFSTTKSHCGLMDTEDSQQILSYQNHTLDDYYKEVRRKIGWKRALYRLARPFVRHYLLKHSSYYKASENQENL